MTGRREDGKIRGIEETEGTSDSQRPTPDAIPDYIKRLFWDCNPDEVSLTQHRSFVIHRILDDGDWDAIQWLRRTIGDDAIREWIEARHGRGLSPRTLRFWQVVLDLPDDEVSPWVKSARESVWERRVG
jgi:succinate dehydrogenase flavin-adding protein (antitoxin of CptAB toxin-antitoxin module)